MAEETCLHPSTKITMIDGTEREINELRIGDKILSFNFETGSNEADEIEEIGNPVHSNLVKLTLSSCDIICTPDHPWWCENRKGWVSVNPYRTELYYKIIKPGQTSEIEPGLFLKTFEGKDEVLAVARFKRKQQLYNISKLKKNHAYYANGVLTCVE